MAEDKRMIAKDRRSRSPALCSPTLLVAIKNQQVVSAEWQHNSDGCYLKGCGGSVDTLPLDYELWPTRAEVVAGTYRTGEPTA